MLSHCANPDCNKPLHYLREGKVFLFSRKGKNSMKQNSNPFQLLEHYWLCGKCAREWTLTMDGDLGVQLAVKKRARFSNTYRRQSPLPIH